MNSEIEINHLNTKIFQASKQNIFRYNNIRLSLLFMIQDSLKSKQVIRNTSFPHRLSLPVFYHFGAYYRVVQLRAASSTRRDGDAAP